MISKPIQETNPAYIIIDVEIKDPAAFADYVTGHKASVEQYGGKFLVASDTFEIIEGNWMPNRLIIQQWPTVEAFKQWYHSEAYRPWRMLRHRVAITQVLLVEDLS